MFKKNRDEVTQREYDGLCSHIFLQQGDLPQTNLAITWVDVAPGSRQMLHQHGPEQVYVIIQGPGRMRVGEEEEDVVVAMEQALAREKTFENPSQDWYKTLW